MRADICLDGRSTSIPRARERCMFRLNLAVALRPSLLRGGKGAPLRKWSRRLSRIKGNGVSGRWMVKRRRMCYSARTSAYSPSCFSTTSLSTSTPRGSTTISSSTRRPLHRTIPKNPLVHDTTSWASSPRKRCHGTATTSPASSSSRHGNERVWEHYSWAYLMKFHVEKAF